MSLKVENTAATLLEPVSIHIARTAPRQSQPTAVICISVPGPLRSFHALDINQIAIPSLIMPSLRVSNSLLASRTRLGLALAGRWSWTGQHWKLLRGG